MTFQPVGPLVMVVGSVAAPVAAKPAVGDVEALVIGLFEREGRPLVRLARLFADDRSAAEDLVQEAFLRLARSASQIRDEAKAAAYLRSIVLNLVRDHNRRGLASTRHQHDLQCGRPYWEDQIALRDEHRAMVKALGEVPSRQRHCLVLRYYQELGIDEIADTLRISRNSVKTHLRRGLIALHARLADSAG